MSEAPASSSHEIVRLSTESDCEALGAFLADRIYEFNVKATGHADATLIAACARSATGEIIAGYNGHTWGGYCELSHLWVDERQRGRGLGSLLLARRSRRLSPGVAFRLFSRLTTSKRPVFTSAWAICASLF